MEHQELMTTDVCTLPTAERPLRLTEFETLFANHLTDLTWAGDRLRLSWSGGGGLWEDVAGLAARESSCCSFFDFALSGASDALVLEVAVPAERREILESLATLARAARR
jgi:hypothetical protein